MEDIRRLIEDLGLAPHPEGGFYRETYRSSGGVPEGVLPAGFIGGRSFSTAIYYLLSAGDFSAFHRIRSDETWHFYSGGCLLIHVLDDAGGYRCIRLGSATREGEVFQATVPAMHWFAAEPAPGTAYVLAGCTVAPGFDFADFEMADAAVLSSRHAERAGLIGRLCR